MTDNRISHALMVSLNMLLFIIVGLGLVAYQVSPLRDPSFIPDAVNAGATVRWMRPESYWMTAINILSIALATNLALLVWFNGHLQTTRPTILMLLKGLAVAGLWVVVFSATWYVSLFFLLWQHIAD